MAIWTYDDLAKRYEEFTAVLRCDCTLITEMVGGLPAEQGAVEQYVEHQLNIPRDAVDPQTNRNKFEDAVQRIMHTEVEPSTPPAGELPEGKLYGLRVVRKTDINGRKAPYLMDFMLKAAIKAASSRMAVFTQVTGSKGSFSEAGRIRAVGNSLQDKEHPWHVFLTNPAGDGPAECYFHDFMGRVTSAGGAVSIVHRSECVAEGSKFSFEFRFMPVKELTEAAVRDILATLMQVGVGSARALERGKFRIERAEIDLNKPYQAKPPKEKEKKGGKKGDEAVTPSEQEVTGAEASLN